MNPAFRSKKTAEGTRAPERGERRRCAPLGSSSGGTVDCPVNEERGRLAHFDWRTRWRSCQMRSDATIPASSTPPTAASSRATPSGIRTCALNTETFTDWLFWIMNASRNASTTTPMITPTQAAEIRVRLVGLPGAGVAGSGPLGVSAGGAVGRSDVGDSSLMTSPPLSASDQEFTPSNLIEFGGAALAVVAEDMNPYRSDRGSLYRRPPPESCRAGRRRWRRDRSATVITSDAQRPLSGRSLLELCAPLSRLSLRPCPLLDLPSLWPPGLDDRLYFRLEGPCCLSDSPDRFLPPALNLLDLSCHG